MVAPESAARPTGKVNLSEGGALSLISQQEDLPNAITAVLNAAIVISHTERDWLPKAQEERFDNLLSKELESAAGKRLLKKLS